MTKWVYGPGYGSADMRNLLGSKGANLAEMSNLGLPVPPGFSIATEVCTHFYSNGKDYPDTLTADAAAAVAAIEKEVVAKFGDAVNPLLVSVRSDARVSMPGMMDTVLNLGLKDETVEGLAKRSQDPRFAYDSYRRFIQMYSNVVLGVDHYNLEDLLELLKEDKGGILDTELTADDLQTLVGSYKKCVEDELGQPFPQDRQKQLWGAIGAVFESWMIPRAVTYRRLHDIPATWGTAVNVQAIVFGNMGEDCATGVAFTRDPSTGENLFYGEYFVNAQGEDVVAGIRTPQHLTIDGRKANKSDLPSMEEVMPEVFGQLMGVRERLETHYRDMQAIEFTVQQSTLYMLQTRSGKRMAAALKIAVDMVDDGLIDERTAGDAEKVKLVRIETSPEDIHGMHAAQGILTTRDDMTNHAAAVARVAAIQTMPRNTR
jgi:pyruvate, orthophosphate dikinase